MVTGDDGEGDMKVLGVIMVVIHHAVGLNAQDSDGKSDPYIVLSYTKFSKSLHNTRIIQGNLNPDEVKGEENVSMMLWDLDKHSVDDLVGCVTVPVIELMKDMSATIWVMGTCTSPKA
ncbi:uncharacterized protein PHACADRAFT_179319 [Phanerochaete carnosa HHB-10118-sp]|uniref:C2 domain-containing protein n=1 Tax=Phanerochaete carnosa (strain HHB-10118-sp) TaxID=650164 RepID=K5VDE2_PHACS|nr:uncharacterized protein PHACADRAFT_179319 [Phanerochaete carnosa HHB-10118-sp]EKM49153.1 hypothetical protein PHACADRAFT_179319 [Phanerochaete carnosa HHB-10118-sp]